VRPAPVEFRLRCKSKKRTTAQTARAKDIAGKSRWDIFEFMHAEGGAASNGKSNADGGRGKNEPDEVVCPPPIQLVPPASEGDE
jgi:hypothetical protein